MPSQGAPPVVSRSAGRSRGEAGAAAVTDAAASAAAARPLRPGGIQADAAAHGHVREGQIRRRRFIMRFTVPAALQG
jgi:hypothetical protein